MKLKMSKEVDLGKEPIGHLLLILALPSITSQVVNALYNMVDRMYIGHIPEIGSAALTGVGVCFPLIMIISAFAYLLGMGGAPRASICMGRKDNKGAEKIMGNCFSSLIIVSIILTAVVLIFQDPLLYLFGASENTIGYAKEYITIYAIGTIFVQLTLGMNSFISAQGFSTISMMTVCIGAVTNIILDPIFIFGLFGVPKMGVAGAAYATILGQWIAAAIGLVMNIRKNPEVSISMKGFRPHGATIRRILAIGIPSVVMQSIGSIMTFLMNQILIAFSATAVAVFGVYFKLQSFVFMPVFGLNNGTVPIVAYNFGARRGDRMRQTIKYSICAAVAIMIVGMLMFQSIPDKLLRLFDASEEMLRLGVPALRIISLAFPLAGFGIGASSVFQALGYSVYSMIISLIRQLVVLIPCAYAIGRVTGDVTGVWWAFVIAELVSLTASALYLRRVNRDVIRTL